MDTKKPVCVITWAWWDIWSELAIKLSSKYSLALIWRTQAKLEKILLWLDKWNHKVYCCDITNEKNIKETINSIISKQWNPAVLVNGAAAFWDAKKIHEYTHEEIDEIIQTNLSWTSKITKEILQRMIQNWWWNIITIWSTCYNWPYSQRLLYAATKSALKSFTETNALDYKKEHIQSNYIFPWPTQWDRVNKTIIDRVTTNEKKSGKNKSVEEMRDDYARVNWWEILKVSNTIDAIQMILDGNISVLSWSTLWIDNFWIFDESHPMFLNKNTSEHEFIKDKKRKYIMQRAEISSKLQDKKNTALWIEFLQKAFKFSKYAAIFLLILLWSKASKIDQKMQDIFTNFKERKYNTKDFDAEFERIAREEYGIENPDQLLNNTNKTQDRKIGDVYFDIGQKALENIKWYATKGYNISGIDVNQKIDI